MGNNKNVLTLTVDMPPSINNDYMKPSAIMRNGKPMAMMYEDAKAKTYKAKIVKEVRKAVKEQGFEYIEDVFTVVEYRFFFPRTNMDTNNYYKCLVDALTESKVIWKDDNVSLMKDKRIYYDSVNPRLELKIYRTEHIGIFDDKDEFEMFKSDYCSNCTKGAKIGLKGGCSVYKKALENRIQDSVEMNFGNGGVKECLAIKIKK